MLIYSRNDIRMLPEDGFSQPERVQLVQQFYNSTHNCCESNILFEVQ